jgi:protein gp37
MAQRLKGRYGYPKDNPFKVTFHPDRLDQPLRWKKPRRIFVVSMGDLFHEDVKGDWMWRVLDAAYDSPSYHRHTYIFLTKRPKRMADEMDNWMRQHALSSLPKRWWLGVTAENQQAADERIPILLQIPAVVKFVSIEPMLGPIDIVPYIGYLTHECECGFHRDEMHIFPMGSNWLCPECGKMTTNREAISWVIVGGESGPGARPMHPGWARSIRNQCQESGTPFFFKQWGGWTAEKGWYLKEGMTHCKSMIVDRDNQDNIGISMGKVGKKKAGRFLDGRTWDEYPES